MEINNTSEPLRLLTDLNQDVFRYGLQKYNDSIYEDPTYLGFTIEIDDTSALFTDVLPFLENKGINRSELKARIPVYNEFITRIKQIFNSQESIRNDFDKSVFIKQHYINSVNGLDNLTKKFNVWKEDILTFELHEDIGLFSSYLSYLYNNLTWSYENGRELIPENLLKFNLYIKISEIRNLTSIGLANSKDQRDQQIFNALKNNVTAITYKLYDCQFDFMNAKPFEDEISQSGIDATPPGHSVLTLDMYYKSVTRSIYNPLVSNAISMNDNKIDLDILIVGRDGYANPSGQSSNADLLGPDEELFQKESLDTTDNSKNNREGFLASNRKPSLIKTKTAELRNRLNRNNEISNPDDLTIENDIETNEFDNEAPELTEKQKRLNDMIAYNDQLKPVDVDLNKRDNVSAQDLADSNGNLNGNKLQQLIADPQASLEAAKDKAMNLGENAILLAKQRATNLIKQKRNELIRTFVNDLTQTVGIKKITPENVYEEQNFVANQLQSIYGAMGASITDDVIKTLTGN